MDFEGCVISSFVRAVLVGEAVATSVGVKIEARGLAMDLHVRKVFGRAATQAQIMEHAAKRRVFFLRSGRDAV